MQGKDLLQECPVIQGSLVYKRSHSAQSPTTPIAVGARAACTGWAGTRCAPAAGTARSRSAFGLGGLLFLGCGERRKRVANLSRGALLHGDDVRLFLEQ